MRKITCLVLICYYFFSGLSHAELQDKDLFLEPGNTGQILLPKIASSIVLRQRIVRIRFKALLGLSSNSKVLRLNLFDDVRFTASQDRLEKGALEGFAWIGHIEGIESGEVVLVAEGQKLSGTITLHAVLYQIRHVAEDLHVVREIDRSAITEVGRGAERGLLSFEAFGITPEREVIDLVNQERAVAGLHDLVYDDRLYSAAAGHSDDMAQQGYFDHTSLDGRKFFERITEAGYPWKTCGENIAGGYSTPSAVVNAWMNSAGHRANILDPNFCDIGVGHAYEETSPYSHYWTQDFGREQGVTTCSTDVLPESHRIVATSGPGGSVSPTGSVLVNHGDDQTFTILPEPGHRVESVVVDGLTVGKKTSYSFENVISDHVIEAFFAPIHSSNKAMPWLILLLDESGKPES